MLTSLRRSDFRNLNIRVTRVEANLILLEVSAIFGFQVIADASLGALCDFAFVSGAIGSEVEQRDIISGDDFVFGSVTANPESRAAIGVEAVQPIWMARLCDRKLLGDDVSGVVVEIEAEDAKQKNACGLLAVKARSVREAADRF